MPQDGSNNYQYPPGTPGIPDQTIESEAYNTFLDDLVVNDLNIARPIHRGGTGGTSAYDARQNLDVEVASAFVTNFDAHVFENGSFHYGADTISAPSINPGVGVAIVHGNPQFALLQARDIYEAPASTRTYTRSKQNDVWGTWQIAGQDDFVNMTGDTMTGNLTIATGASATLTLTKASATSGQVSQIVGTSVGADEFRWIVHLGDNTPESGGNTGSDFRIRRFADGGAFLTDALSINRQSGLVAVGGGLNVTGRTIVTSSDTFPHSVFHVAASNADGCISLQNTGAGGVTWNILTTNNASGFGGGALRFYSLDHSADRLTIDNVGQVKVYATTNSASVSSGAFVVQGGAGIAQDLYVGGGVSAAVNLFAPEVRSNALIVHPNGFPRLDDPGAERRLLWSADNYLTYTTANGNFSHVHTTAGTLFASVPASNSFIISGQGYKPGGGDWADSSDARIKNVLGNYENGLDAVLQLQPVRYTFKGNDTPAETPPSNDPVPQYDEDGKVKVSKDAVVTPYANSPHRGMADKEFIGLIAQTVEGIMPEMVTQHAAMIDGQPVTDMRTLDTTPLLFALVNAVKTLAARVEALEAPE